MLKRNLIANYLGQGWTAIMGLAFIPLYIKYLGIESYGLIGLFALLQTWLNLLDMGMKPTLSREMARFTGGSHTPITIRDLIRSVEIISIGMAIFISGSIALGADWLASSWLKAETLPQPIVAEAFTIMGVVTALRFVEGVYSSAINGLQRQVLLNVLSSSIATLRGVGGVLILIWISPTIEAFFIWQGMLSIVSIIVLSVATYSSLPQTGINARFSLSSLRSLWVFGGGIVTITLLSFFLTQVDKIILSKLLSLSDFGYYTIAVTLAGALLMLASPVTTAWYPRLSELYSANNQMGFIFIFHNGAQLITVFLGGPALVLIFFSEEFLLLWTQDASLAARTAPLVSLLILGNLFVGLNSMPATAQLAFGWTSLSVRLHFVAVLIVVPSIMWVVPRYGSLGASFVWASLNICYVLFGTPIMFRRIMRTEKWQWFVNDIFYPLICGLSLMLFLRWSLPKPEGVTESAVTLIIATLLALIGTGLGASFVRRNIISISRAWFEIFFIKKK